MLDGDTHITYFLDNTGFILALFAILFGLFLYCFRYQMEDQWPDAIFWTGIMIISLFFFWLLHHDPLMLIYVIVVLCIAMLIWMIKF